MAIRQAVFGAVLAAILGVFLALKFPSQFQHAQSLIPESVHVQLKPVWAHIQPHLDTVKPWIPEFVLSALPNYEKPLDQRVLYDFKVEDLDGNPFDLGQMRNKVVLIVNVASFCGFTGQYAPLQALYEKYRDAGLRILGFPCNQFGKQEPGTPAEIKRFCDTHYSVTFPLMSKVNVNEPDAHPLFDWLTRSRKNWMINAVKWNFEKFLLNGEGKLVERYDTVTEPSSLEPQIEELLKNLATP